MSFLQLLKKSVYFPELYQKKEGLKFQIAFLFFFRCILLLSLFVSLGALFFYGTFLYGEQSEKALGKIKGFYPADLIIQINNGEVSLNKKQPYGILRVEENDPMQLNERKDIEYLVMIDTENPITFEALHKLKTVFLVGKESFGFINDNNGLEVHKIPKTLNQDIDRSWINSRIDEGVRFLRTWGLLIVIVVLPVCIFSAFMLSSMLYLLFVAFLIWLIAVLKKIPYGYTQAYITGMYLFILPQSISMFLAWMTPIRIPFLRTILILLLVILNFKKYEPEVLSK